MHDLHRLVINSFNTISYRGNQASLIHRLRDPKTKSHRRGHLIQSALNPTGWSDAKWPQWVKWIRNTLSQNQTWSTNVRSVISPQLMSRMWLFSIGHLAKVTVRLAATIHQSEDDIRELMLKQVRYEIHACVFTRARVCMRMCMCVCDGF